MDTSRRSFVRGLAAAGVAMPGVAAFREDAFARLFRANAIAGARTPAEVAEDELYWAQIQRAFDADRTMINLNNGGISPTPSHVLEQMIRDLKFTNELPVEHMWRILQPRMETTRRELAKEFGCSPEEMAIVRNASEANEIMIYGIDLKKGDEVIVTNQNYGRMIATWQQRERREGIVLKQISFKVPPPSDQSIVDQFAAAITPRTRVIEVTHITNLTGQIMPVREIMRLAKARGIEVFVDGAHAFGQWPMKRDEMEVDFYGTSLHKWLLAPIGAGFLYVRKDRIEKHWALQPAGVGQAKDIRKFEEIGTHPAANHNAISEALVFTRTIGMERKAARLRYLRNRWAERLMKNPKIVLHTPLDPTLSCAIGTVQIKGVPTGDVGAKIWEKQRILATPIVHPEFEGLRVTPNVYTTLDEIDIFADAMEKLCK